MLLKMQKVYTSENVQNIQPSASLEETLAVDKNTANGNCLEIRLSSFNKQLDRQQMNTSIPQKCSFVSMPGQKIKILHTKGTVIPVNNLPIILTQHTPNDAGSIRVASPVGHKNECFKGKPLTGTGSTLQTKASYLSVGNYVKNEKHIEEDGDNQLISPSCRWLSQPRSYRGAKRDNPQRKVVRKVAIPSFVDTTDGETSGMGSSVDEPIESSTESASEASTSFLQPKLSLRPLSMSPLAFKKRRGGWPKGRKRKPELPGTKPPKAPLTAYVLFLNERRKYYKETNSHLPFVEVTKLLGAEWSAMTNEQKAVYVTRSEQDKRRYRTELQTYRQSHDYQILLRKKRMKNAINRGQTTEESSDFTDEVDDDESEELYCRICEQWFSSLHNKREHLYGKPHLQAITGEYQREREAEEKRQTAAAAASSALPDDTNYERDLQNDQEEESATESAKETETDESFDPLLSKLDHLSARRDSIGVTSTTEDDPDDEEEDDEEDREYDGEEEVTEEEGNAEYWNSASDSERVTDAAESVISKVLNREKEIRFLRGRYEKSRRLNRKILTSLLSLQARQKFLNEEKERLFQEEQRILQKVKNIYKFSEFRSLKTEQILGNDTGTTGMPDKTGNVLNFVPDATGIPFEIDKLLVYDSNTTGLLDTRSETDMSKIQGASICSNEDVRFPDSPKNLSVTCSKVSDIQCVPSSQILTGAKSYCPTRENISDVPLENIKIDVPLFVPLTLHPNKCGSILEDRDVPIGKEEKNCVIEILERDSSQESFSIGEQYCATEDKTMSSLLLKESTKSLDSCLVYEDANPLMLPHVRKKDDPPVVVHTHTPKVRDIPNVSKYKGESDHSYSKSRYSPIPNRRKVPNLGLNTVIKEGSNDRVFYSRDDSSNFQHSQVPQIPQASQAHKTLSPLSQSNQRKIITHSCENINPVRSGLSSKSNPEPVIEKSSPCTTGRRASRNIPTKTVKPICLADDINLIEIKSSDDTLLVVPKLCQDENAGCSSHSNDCINFVLPDGAGDDANSNNTFIMSDGNILAESPDLLPESPELKYYVDNLLQDDVGNALQVGELQSLQWDDIPLIEDSSQNLISLPILDNIFEEDYLTNLLYENCS